MLGLMIFQELSKEVLLVGKLSLHLDLLLHLEVKREQNPWFHKYLMVGSEEQETWKLN